MAQDRRDVESRTLALLLAVLLDEDLRVRFERDREDGIDHVSGTGFWERFALASRVLPTVESIASNQSL
jgi:hypothetical protein